MSRIHHILQVMLVLCSTATAVAGSSLPEIGVIGLKDWTKDEELKHPYGFGLYLFQPVSQKVKLTFEYDYLTSKTTEWSYWGWGYNPFDEDQRPVKMIRRNHVSVFEFGFRHLITRSQTTLLEAGVGACLAHLEVDAHEQFSGRKVYLPDADKLGLVLNVGLLVQELKDLPLTMRFGFRHRFLTGSGMSCCDCRSTFSDAITATEVSWGLGYQFGDRKQPASVDDFYDK